MGATQNIVLRIEGQDAGATRMVINIGRGFGDLEKSADRVQRGMHGINTGLRSLTSSAGSALGGVGRLVDGFGRLGLAAVGVNALARALGAVATAARAPIMAASDLSETANKVEVVFGAASKQVREFGMTAAASIGQSNQQAQGAAATFGNLFTTIGLGQKPAAAMSVNLVRLASDLASFHNSMPIEALEALRSGLVGETEPMRRFGVVINETAVKQRALAMGAKEVAGQISEAAKVQARYSLILEQTRVAQGDFARTSTGLANSLRILGAHWQDILTLLGDELLPVITPLVAEFAQKLPAMIEQARPHIQRFGETLRAATMVAVEGLGVLWQAFQTVLPGIVSIVGTAGRLIYEGLSWLNPFATHSPSLVDQVESGLAQIRDAYARLPADVGPALDTLERQFARVQRQVRAMGEALADAQSDLRRFQSAPLAGERGFDDRLFGLDQERARLRLAQIDQERRGPGSGLIGRIAFAQQRRQIEMRLAQIDRESERTRLQRQLTIDPQRRALEQVGRAPEMTFADAMRGAQEAFARVQELAPAYARAQAETEKISEDLREQRDLLAEMKKSLGGASGGLGGGLPGLNVPRVGGPSGPSPSANGPSETRDDIAQPAWVVQAKLGMAEFSKAVDIFKTKMDEAQKTLDGFKTAFERDWKPAFVETGAILKMVMDGDIGGAIERVTKNFQAAWPSIQRQLETWRDGFVKWATPIANDILAELGTVPGRIWQWIKAEAPTFTRRLLAEWVPAFIAGAVGILARLGEWWRDTGQRELSDFAGKMGLAILEGVLKGVANLGRMLVNAIMDELMKVRIPLPGGGEWRPFDGWKPIPLIPGNAPATPAPGMIGGAPAGPPGVPGARDRKAFSISGPDGQFIAVPVGPGDGVAASPGRSGGNTLVIQGPLVEHISVTNEADEDRLVAKISAMLSESFDQATKRDSRRPLGLSRVGV